MCWRHSLSLLLALLLLLPVSGWAAVAVNDTSTGNDNVAATLSWSHTVNSGTTALGVCAVWSNPATTITGVQYNSVSFLANELWNLGQGGVVRAAFYVMLNPPTGAHTVQLDWSASVSVGGTSVGLSGVETSSLAASHKTIYTQAAAAQPSIVVTDSLIGELIIDCIANFSTASVTVGANQTRQFNLDSFGGSSTRSAGTSTETAASNGITMDWTGAAGATAGGAMAFVATGGASSLRSLGLLGVGQ